MYCRGATILTPNEHEVRSATRITAEADAEADRAGRLALDTTEARAVLVTRSARGLTLVMRDTPAIHMPARAREVADVATERDDLVHRGARVLGEARDGLGLEDLLPRAHDRPRRSAASRSPPFTGSGMPATISVTASARAAISWFTKPCTSTNFRAV